jgi:hypothetical protein
MTDYGFNVRNRVGFMQLDNNYIDYFLKESGSGVTINNESATNFANSYAYNRAPIIAYRPTTTAYGMAISRYKISSGKISGFYAFPFYGQSCTFDWRLYCLDYNPTPPDFGIQIFNAYGNQIFCSTENQMKIIWGGGSQVINVPDNLNLGNPLITITHPDYENPFYFVQPNSFAVRSSGVSPTYTRTRYRAGIQKIDSTSCYCGWIPKFINTGNLQFWMSAMDIFCGVIEN